MVKIKQPAPTVITASLPQAATAPRVQPKLQLTVAAYAISFLVLLAVVMSIKEGLAIYTASSHLGVSFQRASTEVKSDSLHIKLYGVPHGFDHVGVASSICVQTVSCQVHVHCDELGLIPVAISGPVTQTSTTMEAHLSVNLGENWKCLRYLGGSPNLDGACQVATTVKLFSFVPVRLSVQQSLGDLQGKRTDGPSSGNADGSLNQTTAKPVSAAAACGPPFNLTSSDTEVTYTWCVDVGEAYRSSGLLGGIPMSLTVPSTTLVLELPRASGRWNIRTTALNVPDLSNAVSYIGGTAIFSGPVDSPLLAGVLEVLFFGNVSMSLTSATQDVLGRMMEQKSEILPTDLRRLTFASNVQWETVFGPLYSFFGSVGAPQLQDIVGQLVVLGLTLDQALGAQGGAVGGYLLDKIAAVVSFPSTAFCTDCSQYTTQSTATETGASVQFTGAIGKFPVNHFFYDIKASRPANPQSYSSYDNASASGQMKLSSAAAAWLSVASPFLSNDGVTMAVSVSNANRVGQASVSANSLNIVSASWRYSYSYSAADDCQYDQVQGNSRKWYRLNFAFNFTVFGSSTMQITSEDMRVYKFGYGDSYVVNGLTIGDAVGSTVLTYKGIGADAVRCLPPSFLSTFLPQYQFSRPSLSAMLQAAGTPFVAGSLTLTVSDPNTFVNTVANQYLVAESIAAVAQVPSSQVTVMLSLVGSRRLARRLGQVVLVQYNIVPTSLVGNQVAANMQTPTISTMLSAQISQKTGVTTVASSVTAFIQSPTTTTTTNTQIPGKSNGIGNARLRVDFAFVFVTVGLARDLGVF